MLHSLRQGISETISNILGRLSPSRNHDKASNREHNNLKRDRKSLCSLESKIDLDILLTPPEKRLKETQEDLDGTSKRMTSIVTGRRKGNYRMDNKKQSQAHPNKTLHTEESQEIPADILLNSPMEFKKIEEPKVKVFSFGGAIHKRRPLPSMDRSKDVTDSEFCLTAAKTKVDLTKPARQSSFTEADHSTKTRTFNQQNIGPLYPKWNREKKKLLTADTVIRLEERDRYRKLLEEYTSGPLMFSSNEIPDSGVDRCSQTIREEDYPRLRKADSILQKFCSAITEKSTSNSLLSSTAVSLEVDILRGVSCSVIKQPKLFDRIAKERIFSGSDTSNISRAEDDKKAIDESPLGNIWTLKWRRILENEEIDRQKRIKREEMKLKELENKRKERGTELLKKIEARKNLDKLEVEPKHPPLTDEMRELISNAWRSGNPQECLINGFNVSITRHDIASLADLNWLNDEIVNFYFNLLQERSKEPGNLKMHFFNSFFYPKLLKTGYAGVRRWTKKVDIFSMDIVVLPVHLGMHWCLAVIDMKRKQIAYYDSLKGNNTQCLAVLRKYVMGEHEEKKKTALNVKEWTEILPKNIPEQLNGCDCGVFACKYAECLTRDASMNFSQTDMPYFRQRMVYEILTKKLL